MERGREGICVCERVRYKETMSEGDRVRSREIKGIIEREKGIQREEGREGHGKGEREKYIEREIEENIKGGREES